MDKIDFILKRLADESEREWGYCSHKEDVEWLINRIKVLTEALELAHTHAVDYNDSIKDNWMTRTQELEAICFKALNDTGYSR